MAAIGIRADEYLPAIPSTRVITNSCGSTAANRGKNITGNIVEGDLT